jgi:hypothetical protein
VRARERRGDTGDSGARPHASTEAREQSVAENDHVWQLTQLAGVCGDTLRAEGVARCVPVVGLHVVLRASAEGLVGAYDRSCRLRDLLFRRDSPDVGDLSLAIAADGFAPAAVAEEQELAAVFEDGFMSCRDGNTTGLSVPPTSARVTRRTTRGIAASSQIGAGRTVPVACRERPGGRSGQHSRDEVAKACSSHCQTHVCCGRTLARSSGGWRAHPVRRT